MADKPTFREEVSNLLHAAHGNPLSTCIQCGTCSGTCPVAEFMDHTPRKLIGMINADLKEEVLESNTFWFCASCFHCTVRCPSEIDIAGLMYALKRYSIWNHEYPEELIGPVFGGSWHPAKRCGLISSALKWSFGTFTTRVCLIYFYISPFDKFSV